MAHTYTSLVEDIKSWMHRNDIEFTNQIDKFIELAESQINKDLRANENEVIVDTIFDQTIWPLPVDYLELRAIHIDYAGGRVPLQQVTPQVLDQRYSRVTGPPRAFAIHGGSLEFRPGIDSTGSPAPTYPGEMTYFTKVQPITVATPTSPVLDSYPNLYLAGCMSQACIYVQDPEQLAVWSGVYNNEVTLANKVANKGRYVNPSVQLA